MIEGAEYLAARGIVPALSVWMPPAGSTGAEHHPPGLDYCFFVRPLDNNGAASFSYKVKRYSTRWRSEVKGCER